MSVCVNYKISFGFLSLMKGLVKKIKSLYFESNSYEKTHSYK